MSKSMVDTFPNSPPAWADVPTDVSTRLFCAGHSALADGRLLVVGGTAVQHTGLGGGNIFDATNYGSSSHGWTQTGALAEGRWYPTATTLGDGRVVTFSGWRYFQMLMFGGVDVNGNRLNDERPLNLTSSAFWSQEPSNLSPKPPGLEGASAVLDPNNGRFNVFGGQKATGYSDTLWRLVRVSTDAGERWAWDAAIAPSQRPSPRSRHSACNDTRENPITADTMWVFGGVGPYGAVGDTVWQYSSATVDTPWKALVPASGPRPGPRYGHTAVWVPPRGLAAAGTSFAQMLVYGGRKSNGTLAGDTLWAFRLDTRQWAAIPFSGTKPVQREGHAAVMDEKVDRASNPDRRRIFMFGGEGSSGLLQDTWILSRPELPSATDYEWTWRQRVTSPSPAARTRHAAIYDGEFERMLVFGGDTNGSTSGGQQNDLWALELAVADSDSTVWKSFSQDSVPVARSGHCVAFHPGPVLAKVPERFTASGSSGSWSSLTGGSKLQREYYPHTFLLRTGKLFWAGNNYGGVDATGTSWIFDPATQAWSHSTSSGFIGSCSVMFRPDTVLKTGNIEYAVGDSARIAVVDSATLNITWGDTGVQRMPEPREFHNLTILPTGKVLLSGGFKFDTDPFDPNPSAYVYFPRLWDPTTGFWSDSLEKDPGKREYHSTVLLLPDGRVLSSGGDPSERGATIYWPPYLYNNDGTLATRPAITGVTLSCGSLAEYDSSKFTVACDTTGITSVCLLKPGAVTHQLNMDQRYVPLRFKKVNGGLTVTGPKTANHAPPGQYLLFILKTVSGNPDPIPSVAAWVRVGPDVVAPGQTTDLVEYIVALYGIRVAWTAPGDDGTCGQAVKYDLRYSLGPITESNFSSATPITTGAPRASGDQETAFVNGLTPCTTYYFALKTEDEAGNWSGMSNMPAITTECFGEGPMASSWGADGWSIENALLGEAKGTDPQTDVYRMKGGPVTSDGQYLLKLSEPDPLNTLLEGVELVAVDHDPAVEAFAVSGGVVLGTRSPASQATSQGKDILSLVDGTSPMGWVGHPGDTLHVGLKGSIADSSLLLIESATRGCSPAESLGIEIRASGRTQGRFRPRARFDEFLLAGLGADRVQLVLNGEYAVRYVGLVSLAPAAAKPEQLALTSATLGGGDVADLVSPGGASVTLLTGSELALAFAAPRQEAKGRDLFLRVRGSWTSLPAAPALRSRDAGAAIPHAFELHAPRPNPARGVVRIGFDAPRTSQVTLEIYDLQGRRVRTLAQGERQAGYYALEWDGRDETGGRVGPGVYLYRMEAPGFHARRKLVVLP